MSWRGACLAFAALAVVQTWRACHRPARPAPSAEACAELDRRGDGEARVRGGDGARPARAGGGSAVRNPDSPADDVGGGDGGFAVSVPAWALWLAPQPGEDLLAYRDRMVPLAQAAVAPHRARVARGREAFAAAAGLDARQQAELDAAVAEAADAIQTRVLDAVLGGELHPSRFKPMTGISAARDVLDAVDRAQRRFLASLREDQRAALARHPFDLADYLVFSTRWEDALGYAPP